jgi:hypothetical protein
VIESRERSVLFLDPPHLSPSCRGPYPLIWAILALYEDPRNEKSAPSRVSGNMIKTKRTGVDSSTVFVLDFEKLEAQVSRCLHTSTGGVKDVLTGNFVVWHHNLFPSGCTRDEVQKGQYCGSSCTYGYV